MSKNHILYCTTGRRETGGFPLHIHPLCSSHLLCPHPHSFHHNQVDWKVIFRSCNLLVPFRKRNPKVWLTQKNNYKPSQGAFYQAAKLSITDVDGFAGVPHVSLPNGLKSRTLVNVSNSLTNTTILHNSLILFSRQMYSSTTVSFYGMNAVHYVYYCTCLVVHCAVLLCVCFCTHKMVSFS